ncbi:MAG: PrsW family glutamic-type intramembrane protease [Candidatus Gracilibacteria bacterium]|nr:PrsW family glutamic-type intramembrane protease [Candidatus Gracilibacteria bacterium]
MAILSLIPIIIITFLPILIWGYIFSYLDNSPLGARRFGIGILAGSLSVIPILFMQDILAFVRFESWNIFPFLTQGDNLLGLSGAILVTIGTIALCVFLFSLGIFSQNIGKIWKTFFVNTSILMGLGMLFSILHTFLFPLGVLEAPIANGGVTMGGVVFGTLKLVFFYYIVIALIEESSKHFCVITSSLPSVDSVKKGVLFSIFIALGFGFIENILYLKNISEQSGLLSSGVLTTWVFRSIFSLMTHIVCSVIVGLYFSRAFITYNTSPRILSYTKTLLFGFIFSMTIHAIFDISLTIGFTGIVFIYFFGGYFGITRIFYEEA